MSVFICLVKAFFCPVILVFQAFRIYFLGCLGTYFERFFRGVCCGICVCAGCTYKDKPFPANASSIGAWNKLPPNQIEWKRLGDICGQGGQHGAKLFSGKIEPADIAQGQVGDCWLMSALACLAAVEGAIQKTFVTKEYNAYGKYTVRLFDKFPEKPGGKWVKVTVDDWIPCKSGTNKPLFAQPHGDEAWVLLLEKAVAKFMGSYAALDGGHSTWAWEALTGNYVFTFKQEGPKWKRYDMVHSKERKGAIMLQQTKDELSHNDMFSTVLFYSRKSSVIGASCGAGSDKEDVDGIVQGHAYSLIAAKEVDGFQMVQLRNPWGTFEWKGAWCDSSPLWQQYPKVARALRGTDGPAVKDDGAFWMEFKDFIRYFKNLDFCFRTTGWDDLELDIHEEKPIIGPCWGCAEGCFSYWFCCKGMRALFCANDRQSFQNPPTGCCATCQC